MKTVQILHALAYSMMCDELDLPPLNPFEHNVGPDEAKFIADVGKREWFKLLCADITETALRRGRMDELLESIRHRADYTTESSSDEPPMRH